MPLLIDEVIAEVNETVSPGDTQPAPLPPEGRETDRTSLTERLERLRERQQRLEVD
jgi:hypothetical protein